jgi:serine protease Do
VHIVRIQCDGKDTCLGTIVGADGWILTKAHDLKGKITCKFSDGKLLEARLAGVHEPHDLAMLRVTGRLVHVAKFADSKNAFAGSWVASIGDSKDPAAIGVVSVPTRKVNDGYLGVKVDSTDAGLMVNGILKNSAAWKAGLYSKDLLLSINGTIINDADHLQQMLGDLKPGDAIVMRVRRGFAEPRASRGFSLRVSKSHGERAVESPLGVQRHLAARFGFAPHGLRRPAGRSEGAHRGHQHQPGRPRRDVGDSRRSHPAFAA